MMKFIHHRGVGYNYYSLLGPGFQCVLGFVDKINGKWYVHNQKEESSDVDLSQAAGPFPTIKSAKAACRLLYG